MVLLRRLRLPLLLLLLLLLLLRLLKVMVRLIVKPLALVLLWNVGGCGWLNEHFHHLTIATTTLTPTTFVVTTTFAVLLTSPAARPPTEPLRTRSGQPAPRVPQQCGLTDDDDDVGADLTDRCVLVRIDHADHVRAGLSVSSDLGE